jgi:hypothetical protein
MIVDLDSIPGSADQPPRSGKFILNETAIVFFSASRQHREVKRHDLSYEDDYRGNAMAGTFADGRVDIRFHEQFPDERVRTLWLRASSDQQLAFLRSWKVYYQGRRIV